MRDSYLAQDHLLLALIKDPSIASVVKEAGLTEAVLRTTIQQVRGDRHVESRSAEEGFDALQKYAIDLTALAQEGKIDPVIGRDDEIRRVIRILCRRCRFLLVSLRHPFTILIERRTTLFLSVNLVSARPPSLKVSHSASSTEMFLHPSLDDFSL